MRSRVDAIVQAQIEELERDERVILMGEDIAVYGGGKLVQRFDARRIWSMPISETSFTGVGIGAAISGSADYSDTDDDARTVATVHATVMVIALVLFAVSLGLRLSDPTGALRYPPHRPAITHARAEPR